MNNEKIFREVMNEINPSVLDVRKLRKDKTILINTYHYDDFRKAIRLALIKKEEENKKGIFDGIKLEESFELLDKDGNYLNLGCLYLEEHLEIGTGKIKYYKLKIKLLGHENTFTPDELKSKIKEGKK